MATSFYVRMAATALRLLTKYGASLQLKRVTPGEYDPSTGTSTNTEQTFPITGAKFDYTAREIDGTRIQNGDARVYVAPNGEKPQPSDTILVSSESWNVINCESIIPATTIVLYDVQVRR